VYLMWLTFDKDFTAYHNSESAGIESSFTKKIQASELGPDAVKVRNTRQSNGVSTKKGQEPPEKGKLILDIEIKIPRGLAGSSRDAILQDLNKMHEAAGKGLDLGGMQVLQFSKPGPPPPKPPGGK